MVGAPEFDTYGVMKAFATRPNNTNYFRLSLLLDSVDTRFTWDRITHATSIEMSERLRDLRSGAWLYKPIANPKQDSLNADSTIDDYRKACALAGIEISQDELDKLGDDK